MKTISKSDLIDLSDKFGWLSNDIHACVGQEVYGLVLGYRIYQMYAKGHALKSVRPRKGAEYWYHSVVNKINTAVMLYAERIKDQQPDWHVYSSACWLEHTKARIAHLTKPKPEIGVVVSQ